MRSARLLLLLPLLGAAAGGDPDPGVYEVQPGDTLWSIAVSAIGDGTLWPALYRANRDQIKDPAQVYPGQRLQVPEVPREERAGVRSEARDLLAR
jgi:nucleoid-associated protein YgaU